MNQLFNFLSRYNRREQTMILAIGLAVILYAIWMLILSPIQSKRDNLHQANIAATQSLGRVQIMTAQIQQLRGQGAQASSGENINGIINTSLGGNGLTMTGIQAGAAGEVRVRLEGAAYEPLMQWLYEIEFQHGLSVRDLSITATNDPGIVSVNLKLKKLN